MTSYAEHKFAVHMFAALYGYCDESEIIEALRAGQACDRFDMLFSLN